MAQTEPSAEYETRQAAPGTSGAQRPAPGAPSASSGAGLATRVRELPGSVARATVANPVLVKEFRTRMRGTRAYWLLLGYTLLLAGVLAIMYFTFESSRMQPGSSPYDTLNTQGARDLGRAIYSFIFVAQAIMVALITPAITAGQVTIEREQRSYELLVTTPLRPIDLIRGKLIAAVSFVVLLLTASLPLVSLSFLVGGVSPAEIFFSYLLIALSAFLYGTIGIFWSATLRTTAIATVVTYLTVLSFFILTLVPGLAVVSSSSGALNQPEWPLRSLNPVMATFLAVQQEYLFSAQVPSWIGGAVLNLLLGLLAATAATTRLEHFDPPHPFWLRFPATLLWGAFGLFLFGPILGGTARGWTTAGAVNQSFGYTLLAMLILVCLVTPVFCTGDLIVRRGENALGRYLRGLLPHRAFASDLSCGLPLMLGWTLFFVALLPLAVYANGKGGLYQPARVFLPGLLLCLSVVFGLAGAGNFLSVLLPSRWAACVLTYLVAVVLGILPYFTFIPWTQMPVHPKEPQLLWQFLYLTPGEGLGLLADPVRYWTDHPAMLFSRAVPVWSVTTIFYLALGVLGFCLAAARIRREGARLQHRMEATERALAEAAA